MSCLPQLLLAQTTLSCPKSCCRPVAKPLISLTPSLMSSPKPAWLKASLPSAIWMPLSAASCNDGPAATAEAKKCTTFVPSKLAAKLTLPGLSALTSSRIASCRHRLCAVLFRSLRPYIVHRYFERGEFLLTLCKILQTICKMLH